MADQDLINRLIDIVGPEWVSEDPAVTIAYSRDMHAYIRFGWETRRPDIVVLPKNSSEVQNIIRVARGFKIPVIPYGSGLNIFGWTLPRCGGIIVDLARMNQIIEINEENATATVEAGCPHFKLQSELLKRRMFIHQPGACSSIYLGSHFTHGCCSKATARLGHIERQIVGYEMVLPDGTMLRTGSLADCRAQKRIWPHGPGPDLGHIPRYAEGALGIVTQVTIKCHPLDENVWPFWVAFDDIDNTIKAYIELLHAEVCTGSSLYAGFKYIGYFSDSPEVAYRQNKIHPEFMLILSLQGTKRRIKFEEKVVREIANKYGGRVITDQLPFYQMFVDSHLNMTSSLYSEYTMRYFGYPGTVGAPGGMVWAPIYDVAEYWKRLTLLYMNDPVLGDPDESDFEVNRSMILYPSQSGHYTLIEAAIAGHPVDPRLIKEIAPRFAEKFVREITDMGLAIDAKYGWARRGEIGTISSYSELASKIKTAFDPDDVMNRGVWSIF